MKKIVLASAAMGGAALVAFGASGTFANFNDTLQSEGSAAEAGTLYLVNGTTATESEVELDNLAPGDSATYAFFVQNKGTVDGTLTGAFKVLKDDENTCYPVEVKGSTDSSCSSADQSGELDDVAVVSATYGAVRSQGDCTTDSVQATPVNGYTIRSLSQQPPSQAAVVPAGEGFCAVVTITVPTTAGNNIQSDQTTFAIEYTLVQATS